MTYTHTMAETYYGNTEEEIVLRFCEEEDLDPADALVGIVSAMVQRHIDRELRRNGNLPPYPGAERPEALTPTMDALHERRFGETHEAKRNELLFRMLCCCSMLAEQRVEEESVPKMRLVE